MDNVKRKSKNFISRHIIKKKSDNIKSFRNVLKVYKKK